MKKKSSFYITNPLQAYFLSLSDVILWMTAWLLNEAQMQES
jgi:hypothetical protein